MSSLLSKIESKKKGSALLWVLLLFTLLVIMSAALLTAASVAQMGTFGQIRSQQAYFTARSAASAVANYIIKNGSDDTALNALLANQGTGSAPNMGSYQVTVAKLDANNLKITARSQVNGSSGRVTAYLRRTAGTSPSPADYMFYVGASVAGSFTPSNINGTLFVNGDFNLNSGSQINGKVVVTGNATLSGSGAAAKGLICFGNAELDSGGSVGGNALIKGDLTFGGGSQITGNVRCDGSLNMPQGYIQGNAVIGKNVTISGGSPKFGPTGILSYLGTLNYSNGELNAFVPAGTVKLSSYTPVDLSAYKPAPVPTISVPSVAADPALYAPAVMTNNTISGDGTITSGMFSGLSYGSSVTIDTSIPDKDISLLVNGTAFDPENGIKFYVKGPHKLFLYLTGNSSFTLGSNQFFGMAGQTSPPDIYIMGDGAQSVNLTNCELDAFVYLPGGSFSASGGAPSTYMFQGNCIAKWVNVASYVSLNYLQPNAAGTPVASVSAPSGGAWQLKGWSNS